MVTSNFVEYGSKIAAEKLPFFYSRFTFAQLKPKFNPLVGPILSQGGRKPLEKNKYLVSTQYYVKYENLKTSRNIPGTRLVIS